MRKKASRTDGQTDRQTNRKQYPLFTGDNYHRMKQGFSYGKLDYVSIEYVIPRCGINPSAHAVLNAPVYACSHDVHVRPFTIGYIHNLLKKIAI